MDNSWKSLNGVLKPDNNKPGSLILGNEDWKDYSVELIPEAFKDNQSFEAYLYVKGETSNNFIGQAKQFIRVKFLNCALQEIDFQSLGAPIFTAKMGLDFNFCSSQDNQSKPVIVSIKNNSIELYSTKDNLLLKSSIPDTIKSGKVGVFTSGIGLDSLKVTRP